MTIHSKSLAALVVGILFGGIVVASLLGWWKTESSKQAAKFGTGEFAGQANPADIRGSYTFGDVENNFGIPAQLLAGAFGVTGDAAGFAVKNLEAAATGGGVEIGTSSVRLFVAFYKNLPFDLSTDIYLPQSAARVLQEHGLTEEQAAYLQTHIAENAPVQPGAVETPAAVATTETPSTPAHEAAESSERVIKGKTTFADLLAWGLAKDKIEAIMGMPVPENTAGTIKDFASANNLDFETIKPGLQAGVDALK